MCFSLLHDAAVMLDWSHMSEELSNELDDDYNDDSISEDTQKFLVATIDTDMEDSEEEECRPKSGEDETNSTAPFDMAAARNAARASQRNIVLSPAAATDGVDFPALVPARLRHFFQSILSDSRPMKDIVSSHLHLFVDLRTGERGNSVLGLPKTNIIFPEALGQACWINHYLQNMSSHAQTRNSISSETLAMMEAQQLSGQKLHKLFGKVVGGLGLILKVLCIYCLDLPASKSMTWALTHDVLRRNLVQPATLADAEALAWMREHNRIDSEASQLYKTDDTKPFSNNLLAKLVFSSDEALHAICSPAFASLYLSFVNIAFVAPTTKSNRVDFYRQILNWARVRHAYLNLNYGDLDPRSPVSFSAELEASLKMVSNQQRLHSQGVSHAQATRASHEQLAQQRKRIPLDRLPQFFGQVFQKMRSRIESIATQWERFQVMPTPPAKSRWTVLKKCCLELQALLMMAILVLSGGQRLQVVEMMATDNLNYNSKFKYFTFYPSHSEKVKRKQKSIIASQLNEFIRCWIGMTPPNAPGLEAGIDAAPTSFNFPATSLPSGGIRELLFASSIATLTKGFIKDFPDPITLPGPKMLSEALVHFAKIKALFLGSSGHPITNASSEIARATQLTSTFYADYWVTALAWRHTIATFAVSQGLKGSEASHADYLDKLAVLMNNTSTMLLKHYDDSDKVQQNANTLETILVHLLPLDMPSAHSAKNIRELHPIEYSESGGMCLSATFGSDTKPSVVSFLALDPFVGKAAADYLNRSGFHFELQRHSDLVTAQNLVVPAEKEESAIDTQHRLAHLAASAGFECPTKAQSLQLEQIGLLISFAGQTVPKPVDEAVLHDDDKLWALIDTYCPNSKIGRFFRSHPSTIERLAQTQHKKASSNHTIMLNIKSSPKFLTGLRLFWAKDGKSPMQLQLEDARKQLAEEKLLLIAEHEKLQKDRSDFVAERKRALEELSDMRERLRCHKNDLEEDHHHSDLHQLRHPPSPPRRLRAPSRRVSRPAYDSDSDSASHESDFTPPPRRLKSLPHTPYTAPIHKRAPKSAPPKLPSSAWPSPSRNSGKRAALQTAPSSSSASPSSLAVHAIASSFPIAASVDAEMASKKRKRDSSPKRHSFPKRISSSPHTPTSSLRPLNTPTHIVYLLSSDEEDSPHAESDFEDDGLSIRRSDSRMEDGDMDIDSYSEKDDSESEEMPKRKSRMISFGDNEEED